MIIKNKKMAIINRQSPYSSSYCYESFDFLSMACAYDKKVDIIFIDDGIYQIIKNQQPKKIVAKNISKMLLSLTHFDIDKIYVEKYSLIL